MLGDSVFLEWRWEQPQQQKLEREGLLTRFDSNSSGHYGEGISNSIRHVMVIGRAFLIFVISCMASFKLFFVLIIFPLK